MAELDRIVVAGQGRPLKRVQGIAVHAEQSQRLPFRLARQCRIQGFVDGAELVLQQKGGGRIAERHQVTLQRLAFALERETDVPGLPKRDEQRVEQGAGDTQDQRDLEPKRHEVGPRVPQSLPLT